MSGNKDWLPSRLSEQAVVFENINMKINTYATALGLTGPQTIEISRICDQFDSAYSYTEQCRATTAGVVQWRDQVFKGTPQGNAAAPGPTYTAENVIPGSKIGIIAEFRDLRDIILASPGYTDAIGQDLMIVGGGASGGPNIPIEEFTPDLKVFVGVGYEVNVSGAMHGMDAMRVEYLRNNDSGTWNLVGFLTRTPGVVEITPHVPGDAEAGRIRARYIKNNSPIGNYSPEYAVTVSA